MANNNTDLNMIIFAMKNEWTSFKCFARDDDEPYNTFLFGYPQEKDNHHAYTATTMVVNPPTTSLGTIQIEKEVVKYNTTFTLQIYKKIPSDTYGQANADAYPNIWDQMEKCFFNWLQGVLNDLGTSVQIGTGSVSITRRNQSANDQQFQIECKFNLDYFFHCIHLD
tara:strand:+ start:2044 stop:2544 length:501 start_codon:yes stop_codon:yes gene_type:complete